MAFWRRRDGVTAAIRHAEKILSVSTAEAGKVVRAAFAEKAAAEADALYFIRHNLELRSYLPSASELTVSSRSMVFVLMETGAEDFAYAFLRKVCRVDARVIRPEQPEHRSGRHAFEDLRRRWLWIQLGVDVLGTDDASLRDAQCHLESGGALVVAHGLLRGRSRLVPMLREVGGPIVPMAALRSRTGFRIAFGSPSMGGASDPLRAIHDQMSTFVRRWPDHWTGWLEAGRKLTFVPRRGPVSVAARMQS